MLFKKTLYILIGPQGSGKTRRAKHMQKSCEAKGWSFARISQDDQGKQGHLDYFFNSLKNNTDVIVVDRINHLRYQRARYSDPARKAGYSIVFFHLNIQKDVCISRMRARKDHPTISDHDDHEMIIGHYFKNFESISSEEYDELISIKDQGD